MPIPQFKPNRSWKQTQPKFISPLRPRQPQKQWLRRSGRGSLIKNLLPYALIIMALGLLSVLTAFAWFSRDLPRPDKIIDRSISQSTKIFDRTGDHLLFEVHGAENRTVIKLEDIPDYVKWGTILVEDKKFYEHQGFDLKGIARAVVLDILTISKAQGGSTLTQQLIKNALLSNEKAMSRKIKELVLAYQIERKFSKDQILQMYFNEIPYGSVAYGIQSASQYYFKKDAKNLTIAESAALAALPKAPTYYSPYGPNKDALLGRKDYIIELLEKDGKITSAQAQEARSQELKFVEPSNTLAAAHFAIAVREQLAKEYGQTSIEEGGLKVITTLDWDMQQSAEEAVSFYAKQNEDKYKATNASLVAIDPKTGDILAMVGSRDYFEIENDGNFNVATQGKRQPGSSMKPLVYALGFEKGYTDKTTLWDVATNFGKGANNKEYRPNNYDLKERGPVSVRTALANSLNIPAVKMLYLVGPENV
ncbi:MAG: transglycosylase domain-containing protein, partial [Candidatus Komeilibacteria bacterium]|nr:transglycosylase domain-containing protein [Candidatus Komeilibacteria bacterium]